MKKKSEGRASSSEAGKATAIEDAEYTFSKEKLPVQTVFNEIGKNVNDFYTTAKITSPSILGQGEIEKLDHNA